MKGVVYIHYGAKAFDPSIGFPIKNRDNWPKPYGGLWASRQSATFGWKEWNENEMFCDFDETNSFKFTLRDGANIAVIHNMRDLRLLPTIESSMSCLWSTIINFEECLRQGYDAVELCWYGDEYKNQKADDMYFGLYGWDCDSIVVLNSEAVIQI